MMAEVKAKQIYQAVVMNSDIRSRIFNLVNQTDAFDSNASQYDIVKDYIHYSGNCLELSLSQLIKLVIPMDYINTLDDVDKDGKFDCNSFYSNVLNIALKKKEFGKVLLPIITLLSRNSKSTDFPAAIIHSLVLGHSNFFQVLFPETVDAETLKEPLVDLLIALTEVDGNVCKENHIGVFLSAYGGSMTSLDQKLLYLIKLYADNNINMMKYSPFLWGKAATAHYSVLERTGKNLWNQSQLLILLNNFVPEDIENTVLNFPLKEGLQPSATPIIADNLNQRMYDFRFYLPLLAQLLSSGSYVQFKTFFRSKVPMLIFASLSSYDSDTRALGYYCLSQLYMHLEGACYNEKGIWLGLLDSVRNSIEMANTKLPCIISLFLGRVADIFANPEHKMYSILYKFITVEPCFDIGQVPEFYKLFNSTHIEYRLQRMWLLELLADGLRTSVDFHLCQKRFAFRTLFVHYISPLSNLQERETILRIVLSAVKTESSAKTLYQNGLLPWLHEVLELGGAVNADCRKSIVAIFCVLQDVKEIPAWEITLLKRLALDGFKKC